MIRVEIPTHALPPLLGTSEDTRPRLTAHQSTRERWSLEKAGEGSKTTAHVLESVPYVEIIKAAKGRDLIVMATHGRTGLSRLLLGSVAERVVRGSELPGADHPLGGLA
ncbi:MAG: universal stress protein [Gammaproteobacteria bacterium]|nr:universal stress protein [Gammaproteobacteria bacterium]